jgi:ParB/RepB/Spo0J family partition protein
MSQRPDHRMSSGSWEGRSVIATDPFRCRMWEQHGRLEEALCAQECKDEIDSFSRFGQLVPVLGRPLRGEPQFDFELIYGARRLFVARHLATSLLIDVRTISDREAATCLDIENRLRRDLSPYERGCTYNHWLRAKLFHSQDELARALSISASQVSRLLKLAELPAVLVAAFPSPVEICETWAKDLLTRFQDPRTRERMVADARALARRSTPLSAVDVYRRLLGESVGRPRFANRRRELAHRSGESITNPATEMVRVEVRGNTIALLLPASRISCGCLDEIRTCIEQILHRASPQVASVAAVPAPVLPTSSPHGSAAALSCC